MFVAVGCLCVLYTAKALDMGRIRLICNEELFKSPYSRLQLGEAIDDILVHTPDTTIGHNYHLHRTCYREDDVCGGFKDIHGHGKCKATLSNDECKSCMGEAYEQLFEECTHSMGAQIQLKDCRLRYETYEFTDDE